MRTEVVLIGTIHHFQLLHPGNTPAHVRATLANVRPDVIGIENVEEWQQGGKRLWTHLPDYSVAEGYAREQDVPVAGIAHVPIGACPWAEPDRGRSRQQRFEQARGTLTGLREWEASMTSGAPGWGFAESQNRFDWAGMEPFLRESLADSAFNRMQDRYAERIRAIAQQYRGRRIAVLVGTSALYALRTRLASDTSIRLLDVRNFLPRPEDVTASLTADDAKLILGASLDGWTALGFPETRSGERTTALLGWLEQQDAARHAATYFRARRAMLLGNIEEAGTLFDSLLGAMPDSVWMPAPNAEWSWPPWNSLRDKALFARANVYDLAGEHARAQQLYQRLLATLPSHQLTPGVRGPDGYFDLRAYLSGLGAEPYRSGAWEVFRIQEARRCWTGSRPFDRGHNPHRRAGR